MSKEYLAVSERAKGLIDKQEGYDVDFKRDISGLDAVDLVAFANSETGGTILIGVDEATWDNGCQRGEIVGCRVGDHEKQSILSKAESCKPPVEVEINIENTEDKPFFRIEIPSGKNKPYCTARGTYVIRGDARTIPLQPRELVTMFFNANGQKSDVNGTTILFAQALWGIKDLDKKVQKMEGHIIKIEKKIDELYAKFQYSRPELP